MQNTPSWVEWIAGEPAALPRELESAQARRSTLALWALGTATLILALQLRAESHRPRLPPPAHVQPAPPSPLPLALALPLLHPHDAAANAVLLAKAIALVPGPGEVPASGASACDQPPRLVPIQLDGRLSLVHFGSHPVCQLRELKRISAAQPAAGRHGVGEVAAFVVGIRTGADVTVTRLVVPPFRFTGETLTFATHDLGALGPGEQFLGTWHTHPDGDLEQGLLSFTDLVYMRTGRIDFHGAVGDLAHPDAGADWLFDIVDPREGDWNVYAHDGKRLRELTMACQFESSCPLNELRLPGSHYFLQARFYEDRGDPKRLFDRIGRSGGFEPVISAP